MAWLNPGDDVLTDPNFTDSFVVVQRFETVDNGGRSVQSPVAVPGVAGVVVAATPDDLTRVPDADYGRRSLKIHTQYPLQCTTRGRKPDLVIWRGDAYIVRAADPYPQYGVGWIRVIATSIDSTEAAIT